MTIVCYGVGMDTRTVEQIRREELRRREEELQNELSKND